MAADPKHARPEDIELIVFDVDGVLTDGTINIHDDGSERKRFYARDGYAMRLWLDKGFQLAIVTGRSGDALKHRLAPLGIGGDMILQGSKDKAKCLNGVLERTGIDASRTAFLADDWPDIPALRMVGYPMAVQDAEPEILELAVYVTARRGGFGAARDAVRHLLEARGTYTFEQVVSG